MDSKTQERDRDGGREEEKKGGREMERQMDGQTESQTLTALFAFLLLCLSRLCPSHMQSLWDL